ncbi:DUF3137 domain-containing protein [Shewanella sp. AS1]|uniref:DUF3137 domain-containing protein n=1 Tax=Shewanella sp. AS1 TaxID=2907626 RepID=UPI001F290AF9|nr:DUF3137 domain-containing protein [Shewanella sp. AS1]MCE9680391.1 DUF3137 domain-containing protein [Shewanella sp. AS1]
MNIINFLLGAKLKPKRRGKGLSAAPEELELFKAHYEEHIAPLTRLFEKERITCLTTLRKRIYTSVMILAVIVLVALLYSAKGYVNLPWPLLLLPVVVLSWWAYRPVKEYKANVKHLVFPYIFSYFGDDFIFNPNQRMSLPLLELSKLLPDYDDAHFDDYVHGSHKGVAITINELKLTKEVRRDKRTETQTQFQGVMVKLGSHKAFKGHTVVIKNRGGLVNFFSDSFRGLSRVKLEDPRFEKQFDVFSTDQIEARYLLTVSFMERLQELASLFDNKIQCAFYADSLLIMLSSRDNRFELGSLFQPATFEYEFSQINREMKQLFAMIDILKLDQKIGL